MPIYQGFISGVIKYENGTPKVLPFQDSIEEAKLVIKSELSFSETFGDDGTKGKSEACPFKKEAMVEFSSSNISWAFIQACMNTLARDAELPLTLSYQTVIKASQITAGSAEVDVAFVPSTGSDIIVSDAEGKQYTVTYTAASGPTSAYLTIAGVTAGLRLTITYTEDPSGTNNEIAFGSGESLGEIGVYGQFSGCPGTLVVQINRGVIQSNLDFGVGSNPAKAAMTLEALRDDNGNYAILTYLP